MVWTLYGKDYDLSEFINHHPGGKEILLRTDNQGDLTALFETYHAFSDKKSIKNKLKQYELNENNNYKLYDFTSYNELLDDINSKLNYKRKNIKVSYLKLFYISSTILLYVYLTFLCFLYSTPIFMKVIYGCILSFLWVSMGFNVMHDASHYGLFVSPKYNEIASQIWNNFGLWNDTIWFYHHVLHHHSFTGTDKDPDTYHYRPFYRKNSTDRVLKLNPMLYPLLFFIFPGFYYGQGIAYFIGAMKGKLFKINIPKNMYTLKNSVYYISKLIVLYFMGWGAISYYISCNIFYNINIMGDHDTYDVLVTNHYTGNDWLKLQVSNSANFLINNKFYTWIFGGINFQIEHHLFPNMSNGYYNEVAPIVSEYCKKNNINYVVHNSLYEVYKEFMKSIYYFQNSTKEDYTDRKEK